MACLDVQMADASVELEINNWCKGTAILLESEPFWFHFNS
jgi:hypothetical protein